MSLACSRSLFFMTFIAGAVALGISYYLEFAVGLKPCGICSLQRVYLTLLMGVCLMASVHGPGHLGTSLYWLLGLCCSLAGTVTAGRQVLLQGDPDSAGISWTLFDLSIPEWSLLFFVAMTIQGVYQSLRRVWLACQRPLSGESSHRALVGD
ncbi:disulfide bond formation protein B [Pseudomonas sp. PB120]|uniref:disulfide bond formation protein B n=1 Tax=Pseudomonas sp. PB120 TaxID=2494700 RepID=UPI0012FD489B|nr:disulfide bond formation protein B [Pseudomonas sp. PB120]MVV49263.1 disulfide bond formation protein B [Pseudomonas sp. PB120]